MPGKTTKQILTPEDAKAKAETFINTNLMSEGSSATVSGVTEDGDLYKVAVTVDGRTFDSYMTKDGKTFFPQGMEITEASSTPEAVTQNQAPAAEVSVKNDKPQVELFVMSHCPYGTQIEKGIIPAVEALGDKIDFKLKFCDYAMHGEKELAEQLRQTCIAKEQSTKILPYLKSFLADEDSDKALTQAGVDKNKLNACITATDKEFKVMEKFADKSTWQGGSYPVFDVFKADNEKYGVGGSPTLVINGEEISSGRDSSSLLGAICSGFNNKPEQCNTKVSSESPSAGFGYNAGTAAGSDASCN